MKIINKELLNAGKETLSANKNETRSYAKNIKFGSQYLTATDSKVVFISEYPQYNFNDFPAVCPEIQEIESGYMDKKSAEKIIKNMAKNDLHILSNTAAIQIENNQINSTVTDLDNTVTIKSRFPDLEYPDVDNFINLFNKQKETQGSTTKTFTIECLKKIVKIAEATGTEKIDIETPHDKQGAIKAALRNDIRQSIYIMPCI